MKRVVPRISRQFPEEFYSDDRQLQSSLRQSMQKTSSPGKYTGEQNLLGSPSQPESIIPESNKQNSTAYFTNSRNVGLRISQSQDNLFKSTQFNKKQQMDFTFCNVEKGNNLLHKPQKILPPLLQSQMKGFQSQDTFPLAVYQLDQFVKPHIKRGVAHQQLWNSDVIYNEQDSVNKMTNDQTTSHDSQTMGKREENLSSSEEKTERKRNEQSLGGQETFERDQSRKQRNFVNLIGNSKASAQQQQQQVITLSKNQANSSSSAFSTSLNIENIHPNISNANINANTTITATESNDHSNVRETKLRYYYAAPASSSLSRSRDPNVFQQKISTVTNPMRQSYQALQKGELKINSQNVINPTLMKQKERHKFINSTIEEETLASHSISKQIQPDQKLNKASEDNQIPPQNKNVQSNLGILLKQNNQEYQNKQQAITKIFLKDTTQQTKKNLNENEQSLQLKLSNITTLPVLHISDTCQSQRNRRHIPTESQLTTSIVSPVFKSHISNIRSQDNLHAKMKLDDTSKDTQTTKPRTNSMQNNTIKSPSFVSYQDKQNYYRTRNTPQSIPKIVLYKPNTNNIHNNLIGNQVCVSPKSQQLRQPEKLLLNENQLDKLQNPEWFYNQLGRPNLYSYQEKRQRAVEHYQRNIQSQQAKEEDSHTENKNNRKNSQKRIELIHNQSIIQSNFKTIQHQTDNNKISNNKGNSNNHINNSNNTNNYFNIQDNYFNYNDDFPTER